MNDRGLLEFAAKAAGIELEEYRQDWRDDNGNPRDAWRTVDRVLFNPLTDDGDALRLAVKLTLEIDITHTGIAVRTPFGHKILIDANEEPDGYIATRLAITRAAAEIGKAMQG